MQHRSAIGAYGDGLDLPTVNSFSPPTFSQRGATNFNVAATMVGGRCGGGVIVGGGGGDSCNAPPLESTVRHQDMDAALLPADEYPLQNNWSFYFLKNDHNRSWVDNLVFIATVRTVEQFWSVINHMQSVVKVQYNSDYMMFKEGIKPMWEDKHNCTGGRWILSVDKRQRMIDIDSCWIHLLLNLIGDHFGNDTDFISGAVVSIRKGNDKMSIWTINRENEQTQRRIGRLFKQFLCLPSSVTICYEPHGVETTNTNGAYGDRKKEVEYIYKE
ncbi:hypothetical protein GJ496_008874 [Pomphorhynchus laevis]|nr:hypothetical protein GJ496_008874 [Pomphorhynchus laevis]